MSPMIGPDFPGYDGEGGKPLPAGGNFLPVALPVGMERGAQEGAGR
jgi:hypothetical protein